MNKINHKTFGRKFSILKLTGVESANMSMSITVVSLEENIRDTTTK